MNNLIKNLTFLIFFTILFMIMNKFNLLYCFETSLMRIALPEQNRLGINIIDSTFKNHYYDKQDYHNSITDISIERFIQLVEDNELRLARNARLHNINDCNNFKYLSKDGRFEYIVKIEKDVNGNIIFKEIVTDSINRGTYNFFNQSGNFWQRSFHHFDVIFWLLYGTSNQDASTICWRLNVYFKSESKCGGLIVNES